LSATLVIIGAKNTDCGTAQLDELNVSVHCDTRNKPIPAELSIVTTTAPEPGGARIRDTFTNTDVVGVRITGHGVMTRS
jgi:hypothetical protein